MTTNTDAVDRTRQSPKHRAVRVELLTATAGEWQYDAKCSGHPSPDLWFNPESVEEANAICRTCPVRGPCERYAARFEKWGTWGATSQRAHNRRRPKLRQRELRLWLSVRCSAASTVPLFHAKKNRVARHSFITVLEPARSR